MVILSRAEATHAYTELEQIARAVDRDNRMRESPNRDIYVSRKLWNKLIAWEAYEARVKRLPAPCDRFEFRGYTVRPK